MAQTDWGTRDSRGEWIPEPLPMPSPLFGWPWKLRKIASYLFAPEGFLWPINLFFVALAIVSWLFFTPSFDRTAHWHFGWVAEIHARNAVLLVLIAGGLHLRLYATKGQGTKFKYTNKWLSTHNRKFLFSNQVWDNVFWNMVSACIIWTGFEAVTLWAYANHWIPYLSFRSHPVYFILLFIGVILWRMFHFYWIHRLIHWKPLYNLIHFVHHKNVNVGPWSGLAMHPLEHLIYFSCSMIHWIVPSNPMHMIFNLQHAALTPAIGHAGFHKFVTQEERGLKNDNYFHYLHHRFFTVNFGNEAVPLDKWFGTWHDGSKESHEKMMIKRKTKLKKMPNETDAEKTFSAEDG